MNLVLRILGIEASGSVVRDGAWGAGGPAPAELADHAFFISSGGELTMYLRQLTVPVPALYGPSADENPFA